MEKSRHIKEAIPGQLEALELNFEAHQLTLHWLEELAVYGTARRPQDTETAYHLSQAIKYWYLVKLATRRAFRQRG